MEEGKAQQIAGWTGEKKKRESRVKTEEKLNFQQSPFHSSSPDHHQHQTDPKIKISNISLKNIYKF